MSNPNKTKASQLGMAYGTACYRLRKMLLFHLAQQLELTKCHRCRKPITELSEFSIDHKKPWLHVDPALFWDLNNVAFSHLDCNTAGRRRRPGIPKQKVVDGKLYCQCCESMRPLDEFSTGARACGKASYCNKCRARRKRERKRA
jgi:hypothetical protein